ncbi:MAG: squalene--hopene cyclase, partial [Planctomycetia bacterium]|nr:squalene--hopene cyclase [Planctomycetia bacterium]
RILLGGRADAPSAKEAESYVLGELPGAGQTNLYFWYYATLALYQRQGEGWERWNQALTNALLSSQRGDGSWDNDTVWGSHGGRVFQTALGALCLEVYYRYTPAIEREARRR